jgi:hypothetical protein
MTFNYELTPAQDALVDYSEEVEVKAVLKKPDEEPEEVVLVPTKDGTGPLTVSFSLNASELALSPTTTIIANVDATVETPDAGPIFERFTHTLTIRSDGSHLEVDASLSSTQRTSLGKLSYEQIGVFDYSVLLKSNSPWGAITIRPPSLEPPPPPPPSPPPLSSKVLGPGDIIFPELVDSIDVTFYYDLRSDSPISQITAAVEITAVLEAAELWSKSFPLLQREESGGSFKVSFPLDLAYYRDALETIRDETGASAESYSLAITANVHTIAGTDSGPIDEVFSQTLSSTLGQGTLQWNEELQKTEPGSIQETRLLPNTNRYLGLSVGGIRTLTGILAGVFLLFSTLSVVLYIRFKPLGPSPIDKEVKRINKKYRARIAFATSESPVEGEKVVSMGSMEDLIKMADELGKSVIYQSPTKPDEKHIYYLLDGATRYHYLV